ncbi:LuxR C-terminal-related transcriptional regulator [Streptomyces sp. NPDC002623]
MKREREERARGGGRTGSKALVEPAAATSGRAVVVSGFAVVASTATLYLASDVRTGVVALLAGEDGIDLRMPVLDRVRTTTEIVARHPRTRVLILTTYDTDADIERGVEAGAIGYLLKDTTREQLVDAIRAAARGETVLAPRVAQKLVARLRRPVQEALTARETDVLGAVADGLTNAEIGRRLVIAEATVKTHLLRLFAKLDVNDRTRAVVVAMERGLLPPP